MSGLPDRVPVGRGDEGFGLVSVIVALTLLSVGIFSLSSVLAQSASMQNVISTRTTALYIATTHMEDLRSRDPSTLASESPTQVNDRGQPDPDGIFTREVTVGTAGRNLVEVVVIVASPRSQPIRLETWIYDGAF